MNQAILYFPPRGAPAASARRLLGRLRRVNRPVVTVTQTVAQFERWAEPGARTLHVAGQPWLLARALAHSAGLLCHEERIACLARHSGTPHLRLQNPESRSAEELLASLPPRKSGPAGFLASAAAPFAFSLAAVADAHYAGSLMGLLENLLALGASPLRAHVCLMGSGQQRFLAGAFPTIDFSFYTPRTLWGRRSSEVLARGHSAAALCAKPSVLRRALDETGEEIFYADVDLHFLRPPIALRERFGEGHTVLFPHWNDVIANERLHGLFNAGLLGVKPGAGRFLRWWEERCLEACRLEPSAGWFGDQGYLDLALLHIEGLTVDRSRDENLGPWNTCGLGARRVLGAVPAGILADGRAVGSFHASQRDGGGLFVQKAAWDQISALRLPSAGIDLAPLAHLALEGQRAQIPSLDRALALAARFGVTLPPSFLARLLSPMPQQGIDWLKRHFGRKRPAAPRWLAGWIAWQRRAARMDLRRDERRDDAHSRADGAQATDRSSAIVRTRRKRPHRDPLGNGQSPRGV